MCIIAAGAAGAGAALAANVAIATTAVSAIASVGMGMYAASQQAAAANAQMEVQAANAQIQNDIAAQSAQIQINQSRASIAQAQQQHTANIVANQQQHQNTIAANQEAHRQTIALQDQQFKQSQSLNIAQSNATLQQQYNQQRKAVDAERGNIMKRNETDRLGYQRSVEAYQRSNISTKEAANRAYVSEQTKLSEARKKAAFAQQAALAKSIGTRGNILAAGRTGQSVGLLMKDVDRQAGFTQAQNAATYRSATERARIGMGIAETKSKSADNTAYSQVGWFPVEPYMPSYPDAPIFMDPADYISETPFT